MARYTVQLRKVIDTVGEDQVLKWFQDYDLTNYLTFEEIKVEEEIRAEKKKALIEKEWRENLTIPQRIYLKIRFILTGR